tara:strand:+ start:721 stop:1314 length:594 start_codon:yes stop_codon:yes gene_type:complete
MATSEKAINFMQESMERGRPVPGQSLTNDPDQKYNWEKPTEYSNSREANLAIFELLTVPETTSNILESLIGGVSVIDISSIILYQGFLEGKWNPDLMTLLMEPTMYMIIALAQKADIEFKIDSIDEKEETGEKTLEVLNKGLSQLDKIKNQTVEKINPQVLPSDVREMVQDLEIPKSILSKVEDKKESNQSLLSKGE